MTEASPIAADLVLLAIAALLIGLPAFRLFEKIDPSSRLSAAGNVSPTPFGPFDLLITICLGAIFWLSSTRENLPPSPLDENQPGFLAVVIVLLVTYLIMARRISPTETFGLFHPNPTPLILWSLAAVAMGGAGILLSLTLAPRPPLPEEIRPQGFLDLLGFLILAPLALELIFRGFIYGTVKRFSERFFAALISALLFSVITSTPDGFPSRIALGLCLCVAYEATGSLWVPIAAHAAIRGGILLKMTS